LLIIAVAFFANAVTSLVLTGFGVEPAVAGNIAYVVMIIAAVLAFVRLNNRSGKR
jgi:predicted Co/Zn/Cd cation transporter (cation efflux family)